LASVNLGFLRKKFIERFLCIEISPFTGKRATKQRRGVRIEALFRKKAEFREEPRGGAALKPALREAGNHFHGQGGPTVAGGDAGTFDPDGFRQFGCVRDDGVRAVEIGEVAEGQRAGKPPGLAPVITDVPDVQAGFFQHFTGGGLFCGFPGFHEPRDKDMARRQAPGVAGKEQAFPVHDGHDDARRDAGIFHMAAGWADHAAFRGSGHGGGSAAAAEAGRGIPAEKMQAGEGGEGQVRGRSVAQRGGGNPPPAAGNAAAAGSGRRQEQVQAFSPVMLQPESIEKFFPSARPQTSPFPGREYAAFVDVHD